MVSLQSLFFAGCIAGCDAGNDGGVASSPPKVIASFEVQGMHCNGCVEAIKADVLAIDGVTAVTVSLEDHTAVITVANSDATAKAEAAIRALGYTVTPIAPR
ncbi:MAG: heavy-metal-associated domain-containing protein [Phycisphaerales bacterium]|nr:heavy-metal-associated domain-containing protein [Phycisphaerales bacterium]